MEEPYKINSETGECTLTKMSKEPDREPNAQGSWGIGMYSTKPVFDGECDGYGFYRPANPNNFFPDYESCEPWEIANHKLACELYNQGKWKDQP
jgi:hypothetical protein